jgi:hypothetical protein
MRTGAIVVLILALGISTYLLTRELREAFGTSPGTMVQLQTSHVPTEEDYVFYRDVYPKMVRREITELTEGDPGELRPWIFPWYGRGVSFFR